MAEYLHYNFNVFILKKDINDAVLRENPVPATIQRSKKLDDYFIEILREKSTHSTVTIDSVLKKM